MTATTQNPGSRKVSGASKEAIFSAYYHNRQVPVELDGVPAKATVLQVRGAAKPNAYDIMFHVVHPCGKKETVNVPEYVLEGSEGGEIRKVASRVTHSSR